MMKYEVKSVFIAGGTGFIGYHAALLFLQRGCAVSTIALPNEIDLGNWYPKDVETHFGDLFKMDEEEIVSLFEGKSYDTFIYCLGPDDREIPTRPAYNYFHSRLVIQARKICQIAKKAGIKRCVVMNSYFAYFDRVFEGKLSKKHPYIRCRVEQACELIELGENGVFDVMIMELPYIFGAMPERSPIWKRLFVERFRKLPFIFFPGGSTAAVHVKGVAQAIFAAACNGKHGERYLISNTNVKYSTMFKYMLSCAGYHKKYIKMPVWLGFLSGAGIELSDRLKGRQSGLNIVKLMTDLLHLNLSVNPMEMKEQLNYNEFNFEEEESIWEGIKEAMKKSYPDTFISIPNPVN